MRNLNYISLIYYLALVFLIISLSNKLYAKNHRSDTISKYFSQIQGLISKPEYNNIPQLTKSIIKEKNELKGKKKVLALLKLYDLSKLKSAEKAKLYNNEALEISKLISYKKGEITSRINNAYLLFIHANFDSCIEELNKIELENEYSKFSTCYADLITLKSYVFTEKVKYEKALELGFNLLSYAEKSGNDYCYMKAFSALSHYYLRTKNYNQAFNYCLKNLNYIIKLNEIQYIYPKIDEIARLTAKLNNPHLALETYDFGLKIEEQIQSAGSYIKSSVYYNMADIYLSIKEYNNAKKFLSQALNLDYQNNYKFRIPRALQLKAKLHLTMKDTLNAISFYEQSLNTAEQINAFDVVKSNSLILQNLYQATNNLSKAFEYKNIYNALNDSLFNNEKEQKIIILETRREIAEITQIKEILELKNKVQRNQFNFAIAILIFIILICIITTYSFLKMRQKNKILYRKTIELVAAQSTFNKTGFKSKSSNPKSPTEETTRLILHRLKTLEDSHFFLNPNCNLNDVSVQLKTNPKYLSQVINKEKKTNFNNYINDLRIEYLISKLWIDADLRNSKLSYMSASVGFNNINTFKNAFKKRQGILPSSFINELNKENNIS
jgi:YesN/AraC family two-component response regulator